MTKPRASCQFLLALLAATLLFACSRLGSSGPGPGQVKVEIASIGFDRSSGSHFILLKSESGNRSLPIMIGDAEARAIAFALHGVKPPRPLTADLLSSVIEQTGNKVDRVAISALHNQIYYARIYLDHGRYRIDSRPSDAIALAVRTEAPIYVAADLLQASAGLSAGGGQGNLPKTATALGITVQELTRTLAPYFATQPNAGVLVAAVDGKAAMAGLQTGDIVTGIGSHRVRNLEDFRHHAALLASADSITVKVLRNGGKSLTIRWRTAPQPR